MGGKAVSFHSITFANRIEIELCAIAEPMFPPPPSSSASGGSLGTFIVG